MPKGKKKEEEVIPINVLSLQEFAQRYSGSLEQLETDVPYLKSKYLAECKIPGYGWTGCTLDSLGFPTFFWDDDDGWNPVPAHVSKMKVIVQSSQVSGERKQKKKK